jgi:flagellar biosynthetic protein FliP
MINHLRKKVLVFIILSVICNAAWADNSTIPLLTSTETHGITTYSLPIKIIAVMTALSVVPALLITMSAFTRIIIVLAIVRQAIGIPNVPSNQILLGLALIMTIFVMMPIIQKIDNTSLQPYLSNKMTEQVALQSGSDVLKGFMLKQTRRADLNLFAKLAHASSTVNTNYPIYIIIPAFISSELKTAFQIGFVLFLPFLIVDLVVASVLMSMGMMMLSPMVISLPFKILFFVLVNGWTLLITTLITSFRM